MPSISPDIAGYKIYYGTASHSYSNVVDVGNTNRVTINGLIPGATYYFAATTVDALGNESGFSNEAGYTVPVTPATLASLTVSAGQFSFNVTGDPGQLYVVQMSTNLQDWISVQTNTVPFQFTESNATGQTPRFYRAFYLQL